MENKKILFKTLIKFLEKNLENEFNQNFKILQGADLTDFFYELNNEQKISFFRFISNQKIAELFQFINKEQSIELFTNFSSEKNALIIENMAPDDATNLLTDVEDKNFITEVLSHLKEDKKKKIEKLLPFDKDSAGGIMTSELCAFPHNLTVQEALHSIGRHQSNDPITFIYIIEPNSTILLGTVSLLKLIGSKPEIILEKLVEKNYAWVNSDKDQEKVVQLFRRYNLSVIPVVNEKHQLIGRITADDIIDISVEEADEDISKMAGTPDLIKQKTTLFSIIQLRLPWLIMTMILALINSSIISQLLNKTQNNIALAIFIPVIMAMGGNTGIQSATIYVRELALGNSQRRLKLIIIRETILGFSMGTVCGIFGGIISYFILNILQTPMGNLNSSLIAIIVGLSILNAMTFSSCFGAIIPSVLIRINIDPAVSAGPFVTTLNDITAVIIYFITNLSLINFLL